MGKEKFILTYVYNRRILNVKSITNLSFFVLILRNYQEDMGESNQMLLRTVQGCEAQASSKWFPSLHTFNF